MDISVHLPQGSQNIMEDKVEQNKYKSKRLGTSLENELCTQNPPQRGWPAQDQAKKMRQGSSIPE